jgi:hypothetical protein
MEVFIRSGGSLRRFFGFHKTGGKKIRSIRRTAAGISLAIQPDPVFLKE